jgi:hypothetical protein
MGLLDGGLARIFRGAFAGIFLDATLHRRIFTEDGLGGGEASWVDEPVKASLDLMNERMRSEGFADADQRILVLAHGVAWPNTDDEITLKGKRWAISQVATDPAQAAYDMRGRVVNVDRPAEAALVATGGALFTPQVPQLLAVSDFQNGTYSILGQPVALEDMWRGDGGTDADPFTTSFLAGSIIPGVGWQTSSNVLTQNSLYSTEEFKAALPWLDGITAVLEYSLIQGAGSITKPRIVLTIADAAYGKAWGFYQNGAAGDRYVEVYDFASAWVRAPAADTPVGDTKVAATLAPEGLAFSVAGAAPYADSPADPMADLRWIEISSYTSHTNGSPNPSIATLKKISFYSAVPNGMLAGMAA